MTLAIHLLGGFQVRRDRAGEARFESQKVRGLLAYLACHPDRAISRELLAELFWPDADAETGRRNLRQALYNLRRGLGDDGTRVADSGGASQGIRLDLARGDRVDVYEFLEAYRRGLPGGGEVAAGDLQRAAELYSGDLLAGFGIRGASSSFEDWLVTEQERLREAAIQALRALREHFAARGEYDAALSHGRRLVEIDPLSEESHRELMRLYVLAGRRRRALAQFEELAELLERELGVEPLVETRSLYQSILAEDLPATASAPKQPARTVLGPFVPLVGRTDALAALSESWHRTLEDGARLTLVEGPSGIGRTRLVKSFLDRITSQRRALVVQGRCFGPEVRPAGQPLLQLLRGLHHLAQEDEPVSPRRSPPPIPGGPLPPAGGPLAEHLDRAVAAVLDPQADDGRVRPLILFVDDLHWASPWVCERLAELLRARSASPLWLVACSDPGAAAPGSLTDSLGDQRTDRMPLTPLSRPEVDEICGNLVPEDNACKQLAIYLHRASVGLPLSLVEHLNQLCDRGVLVPASRHRWNLAGELDPAAAVSAQRDGDELDSVIAQRTAQLPTSTRRLLVLAAIIGQTFDVELLQRAAREHIGVVEIGIELLLERWLIRQFARRWSDDPRERDLVLWAQGARRGTFEFAHQRIRRVAYRDVNPIRRRVLHREVADALAERNAPAGEPAAEIVAYHYLEAGEPELALPHVRAAAVRAERIGDGDAAAAYLDQALDLVDHLCANAGGGAQRRWRSLRGEIAAARAAFNRE